MAAQPRRRTRKARRNPSHGGSGGRSLVELMPGVPEIGEFVFRANPSFELLVFDRLTVAEKSALAPLASDTDFYGVLRPSVSGLNLKSVNRDLALLFCTLQTPGKMPAYVRAELGAAYEDFVTQLVLDQVLQVEDNGAFVCGAGAQHLLCQRRRTTNQPRAFRSYHNKL